MSNRDTQPLLRENRQERRDFVTNNAFDRILLRSSTSQVGSLHPARKQTQRFLTSKLGHYSVLALVSLDVSCIFADFLISLYVCDHSCRNDTHVSNGLLEAQNALGIVSLVFSCLFMVELLASIWAFGPRFFKSKFHCFDALVIIAGFIVDVCLKGVLEEAGSIVIVLRLWRVFKIIEEFSSGAEEEMDTLSERIERLEMENDDLKKDLRATRSNISSSHAIS